MFEDCVVELSFSRVAFGDVVCSEEGVIVHREEFLFIREFLLDALRDVAFADTAEIRVRLLPLLEGARAPEFVEFRKRAAGCAVAARVLVRGDASHRARREVEDHKHDYSPDCCFAPNVFPIHV